MVTVILILIIILLAGMLFFTRFENVKIMNRLDLMLDAAIAGTFSETEFSETKLSKIETKMYRYLSVGKTSLAQINKEKDTIKSLISDISHQTKTPITNISLYSELLCDSGKLSGGAAELAENIELQAEKLKFLIGALIKISRLENGIVSVLPEEQSVERLLSGLDFDARAKSKNIDLIIEKDVHITAFFDFKWTLEALSNIVDNAIKYTNQGGKIKISAVPYEMFVKIDIEDNGIGIGEEDLPKIFTRFYRAQKVREHRGVGIRGYGNRQCQLCAFAAIFKFA